MIRAWKILLAACCAWALAFALTGAAGLALAVSSMNAESHSDCCAGSKGCAGHETKTPAMPSCCAQCCVVGSAVVSAKGDPVAAPAWSAVRWSTEARYGEVRRDPPPFPPPRDEWV